MDADSESRPRRVVAHSTASTARLRPRLPSLMLLLCLTRATERGADWQAFWNRALGVGYALLCRIVAAAATRNAKIDRTRHDGQAERLPPVHAGDGHIAAPPALSFHSPPAPALQSVEVRPRIR